MTTTYTLTGSLLDATGADATLASATLGTNLGDVALVDLDNGATLLPARSTIPLVAGAFSLPLIATDSTGINVPDGSLRYIVHVEYRDGLGVRRSWNSGYFELTANTDLADVAGTDVVADVDPAIAMIGTLVEQAMDRAAAPLTDWATYLYGNSYAVLAAGWFTPTKHYAELFAERLDGGTVTSYAVSGRRILDVCSTLINGLALPGLTGVLPAGEWDTTTARSGLVVLDSIINDIGHYPTMIGTAVPAQITTANTRYLDSIKAMYRTALALMSSESRVEQNAGTFGGTWTQTNQAGSGNTSGGTIGYTSTVGASLTYTLTPPQSGPLAGKVFLLTYSLDPSIGNVAATINISVDGGAAIPFTLSPWEQYTGHAGTAAYQIPVVIPVTVPIDGATHTVAMTHAGTAGHFMYADAAIIPSSSPNPIAVMGGEHVPNVGVWTQPQINAYRYNIPLMVAAVRAVVAEFGNAFYVPSTMTAGGLYSGDGLHPNDRGMAQRSSDLVNAVQGAIKARLDSRALAAQPDADFAIT